MIFGKRCFKRQYHLFTEIVLPLLSLEMYDTDVSPSAVGLESGLQENKLLELQEIIVIEYCAVLSELSYIGMAL